MDILEKAELTASILYIARFLKSGTPIYNSEVPDKASRKTKKNTGNCKAFCASRKRSKEKDTCNCKAFCVQSKRKILIYSYLTKKVLGTV